MPFGGNMKVIALLVFLFIPGIALAQVELPKRHCALEAVRAAISTHAKTLTKKQIEEGELDLDPTSLIGYPDESQGDNYDISFRSGRRSTNYTVYTDWYDNGTCDDRHVRVERK
jgi:hypothetical protein